MYPTISHGTSTSSGGGLQSFPLGDVGGGYQAPQGGPRAGAGSNGQAAAAASPPTALRLQVKVADPYRLTPPVPAPPLPPGAAGQQPAVGLGSAAPPPPPGQPAPASRQPVDLAFERQLVADAGRNGSSGSTPSTGSQSLLDAEEPYAARLARYTGMGYSREEAACALAVVGPSGWGSADRVGEAARKFRDLRSMGFRPEHVAGALVLYGGDLDRATDGCLSAGV